MKLEADLIALMRLMNKHIIKITTFTQTPLIKYVTVYTTNLQ